MANESKRWWSKQFLRVNGPCRTNAETGVVKDHQSITDQKSTENPGTAEQARETQPRKLALIYPMNGPITASLGCMCIILQICSNRQSGELEWMPGSWHNFESQRFIDIWYEMLARLAVNPENIPSLRILVLVPFLSTVSLSSL